MTLQFATPAISTIKISSAWSSILKEYPYAMGSRLDFLLSNREAIRAIAFRHKALSISVFGSVARGEDRLDSDYDFLVEFKKGSSLIDLSGLVIELEDFLDTPVDVVSIGGLKPRDQQIRQEAIPIWVKLISNELLISKNTLNICMLSFLRVKITTRVTSINNLH